MSGGMSGGVSGGISGGRPTPSSRLEVESAAGPTGKLAAQLAYWQDQKQEQEERKNKKKKGAEKKVVERGIDKVSWQMACGECEVFGRPVVSVRCVGGVW